MAHTDLSGMGVAGERQGDVRLMKHATAPMARIMTEQDLEHTRRQPGHGFLQIAIVLEWRPRDILHTDHGDGILAPMDEHMTVEQQLPAYLAFEISEHRLVLLDVPLSPHGDILTVVVVAHDRVDPILGLYLPEGMLKRNDFLSRHVDEVTGEHYKVGMLIIDKSHELRDEPTVAEIGPDMDIGEL